MVDRKTGVVKREGLVKPEMMKGWLNRANVVLRGGGLDESPHCYKRLPEVLAAHGETHPRAAHADAAGRGDGGCK